MEYLRDHVLALMRKSAYRPMTFRELVDHFGVPRGKRDQFERIVEALAADGEIVLVKGKRYGLARKMNLVAGRLSVHPDGFGFVTPDEGGEDLFVGTRDLNTALHGDKVVVRLETPRQGRRPEGRVIRILERANRRVVGRFERFSGWGYLTPWDPRLATDLYVPARNALEAKTGDMAVAEIVAYTSRNRTPEGRIVEVLGPAEDPGVDEAVVIRHYDLPYEFPAEARGEARDVPREVGPAETRGRVDLRNRFTVTIDGENARDFDDAVSIARSDKGTWQLWVHVADVAHYVRPGTAVDREARLRGTSVYFPGMVLPMLPEELSNGICSLNPDVDRLAMTVFLEADRLGHVTRYDFLETVIRSDARMTYGRVRDILAGDAAALEGLPPGSLEQFRLMEELSHRFRGQRMRRGSIDFDLPEAEIVLDLRGRIQDIVRSERNVAHRIIEEFMLAANRTVAASVAELEIPFLYRVHEEPDAEKMDLFRRFVAGFGHVLPQGELQPLDLSRLVAGLEGRPEAKVVNNLLLRSMKQARYSAENSGHFGLAFDDYTHFTSPIRRYPDLTVHRILKRVIRSGPLGAATRGESVAGLPALAEHCSERERVAMEAEREIVQLKKIRFMLDKVGEEFDAFVTGVTNFGFFAEPADVLVEGLVHVSSLGDDYYVFDEEAQALTGEHTHRSFRTGDPVRVRVDRVDLERRRIDFGLLEGGRTVSSSPRPAARKPKAAGKRSGGEGKRGGGRGRKRPPR